MINLLNAQAKVPSPAYTYSIRHAHRYEHVVDQEKVYERLEKEFEIFVNSTRKALNEQIHQHNEITPQKRSVLESKLAEEIAEAKATLAILLENPDDYEMRFSAFEGHKIYTCIDYTQNNKEKIHAQTVRETVANLLWFEARVTDKEDITAVEAFIKDPKTTNPFSRIYIRPKDKS